MDLDHLIQDVYNEYNIPAKKASTSDAARATAACAKDADGRGNKLP